MPEHEKIPETESPHPRTVLGFDFGHRRIGVAVGHELTGTAGPLATLETRRQQPDWEAIDRLIDQWQPDLLVVGITGHADGAPHPVTEAALQFSRQLQARYQLPVQTIDERLSSWEAEALIATRCQPGHRRRRDKSAIDQVAAALILESWFNQ